MFADVGGEPGVALQLLALRGGPAALPDNRVANGLSGVPVPKDGCFPLVRNANRGNLPGVNAALREDFVQYPVLTGINLHRVVLDPAGAGVVLCELPLRHGNHILVAVEQDTPTARRALVKREDVLLFAHMRPPCGHCSNSCILFQRVSAASMASK